MTDSTQIGRSFRSQVNSWGDRYRAATSTVLRLFLKLVSAVFEDAVRRIASSRELETAGTNLDALITGLERAGVCSAVAARRWRAVAALRNKALHAQWNDFTLQDIGAAITLVKEIVETNLVSPL